MHLNQTANQIELNIKISTGVSLAPDDTNEYEELLNIADQRMYGNRK